MGFDVDGYTKAAKAAGIPDDMIAETVKKHAPGPTIGGTLQSMGTARQQSPMEAGAAEGERVRQHNQHVKDVIQRGMIPEPSAGREALGVGVHRAGDMARAFGGALSTMGKAALEDIKSTGQGPARTMAGIRTAIRGARDIVSPGGGGEEDAALLGPNSAAFMYGAGHGLPAAAAGMLGGPGTAAIVAGGQSAIDRARAGGSAGDALSDAGTTIGASMLPIIGGKAVKYVGQKVSAPALRSYARVGAEPGVLGPEGGMFDEPAVKARGKGEAALASEAERGRATSNRILDERDTTMGRAYDAKMGEAFDGKIPDTSTEPVVNAILAKAKTRTVNGKQIPGAGGAALEKLTEPLHRDIKTQRQVGRRFIATVPKSTIVEPIMETVTTKKPVARLDELLNFRRSLKKAAAFDSAAPTPEQAAYREIYGDVNDTIDKLLQAPTEKPPVAQPVDIGHANTIPAESSYQPPPPQVASQPLGEPGAATMPRVDRGGLEADLTGRGSRRTVRIPVQSMDEMRGPSPQRSAEPPPIGRSAIGSERPTEQIPNETIQQMATESPAARSARLVREADRTYSREREINDRAREMIPKDWGVAQARRGRREIYRAGGETTSTAEMAEPDYEFLRSVDPRISHAIDRMEAVRHAENSRFGLPARNFRPDPAYLAHTVGQNAQFANQHLLLPGFSLFESPPVRGLPAAGGLMGWLRQQGQKKEDERRRTSP